MRYLQIITASLLFLLSLLIVSILIDVIFEFNYLSLNTLASVATVACSIPTAVIAFLLYRRFSGTQLLVDRQTAKVMDLVEKITDMNFFITVPTRAGKADHIMTDIYLRDIAIVDEFFRDYAQERYKEYSYYADKDLLQIADYFMNESLALYIPKPIADILFKHFNQEISWWVGQIKKPGKKDLEVSLSSRDHFNPEEYEGFYGDNLHIDVFKLSASLCELYEACLSWIKQNNYDIYKELNIRDFQQR